MPMKPLSFKGDKKSVKKRKHHETSQSDSLTATSADSRQNTTNVTDDDSWTSPSALEDLTGPTVIVLSTVPPTCLASDANGRIFASPLENMIENDPRTAEPHDVRQVWVATRTPGNSTGAEAGDIGFKGAHGGWLSCDAAGVLGATREARGTEEGFILEQITDDQDSTHLAQRKGYGWRLRTAATKKSEGEQGRKYLCAVVTETSKPYAQSSSRHDRDEEEEDGGSSRPSKISVSLRGNGEANEDSSRVILRMQARFLPKSAVVIAQQKSKEKITRAEIEKAVGRRLEDEEVRRLKRAKRHGTYHEEILDMRVKGIHDKFA